MTERRGPDRATVIGAGAWGTALALVLARGGARVGLWCRRAEHAAALAEDGENRAYLPGSLLPTTVLPTDDPALACAGASTELVVLAVPSAHLASVAARFRAFAPAGTPVVVATKGIDVAANDRKLRTMADVAATALPGRPMSLLSGPSFATEVARDLPTALTLAALDRTLADRLAATLHRPSFRVYPTDDVTGVALGGAIKNVIAIASGICHGRALGHNARAALLTRGLAETSRLSVALGARLETLMGLSGLGDLVLTGSGRQSRNFSLGLALAEGTMLAAHLSASRSAVEGVAAASAVMRLARGHRVDMPITATVEAVLSGAIDLDTGIRTLLERPADSGIAKNVR